MDNAITLKGVSLCGTKLVVQVDAHEVTVPMDDRGWEVLRGMIERRAEYADGNRPTIGTPASPTQAMVDEFIKVHGVKRLSADRREALQDERYLRLFGDEELDLEIEL